ncbi:MAG: hypothetical protein KC684_09770, partial [Candidatus Omnitrophica bacterium]|nr:hypothetical protein [Candidatus Omnitrophota bacterium]
EGEFAPEIESILFQRMEYLKEEIAKNPLIIRCLEDSNEKNRNISLKEIREKDRQWLSLKEYSQEYNTFVNQRCSNFLKDFQQKNDHDVYVEIFITDLKGLNVAMTNKTTDYYQADEEWWVKVFSGGKGYSYYGDIEIDESALSHSISLYLPIKNTEQDALVGVMKVVLDIVAIKREL